MYISSSIFIQPNKLYKASVVTSWYYFGHQEQHETFTSIGEAKDWIMKIRCPNHEEQLSIPVVDDVVVKDERVVPTVAELSNIKLKKTKKNE